MEKAKFWVDFCFEADDEYGDGHVCHRYGVGIELTDEEFEELYQVWNDKYEVNGWSTVWEGHEALYDKIDDAARYALDTHLENEDPVYQNPLDVLWELSQETIDAF